MVNFILSVAFLIAGFTEHEILYFVAAGLFSIACSIKLKGGK